MIEVKNLIYFLNIGKQPVILLHLNVIIYILIGFTSISKLNYVKGHLLEQRSLHERNVWKVLGEWPGRWGWEKCGWKGPGRRRNCSSLIWYIFYVISVNAHLSFAFRTKTLCKIIFQLCTYCTYWTMLSWKS